MAVLMGFGACVPTFDVWTSHVPNIITWTPKVCKIMAFMAIIMGLGLLFYILLGFRYCLLPQDLGHVGHSSGIMEV